LDKANKPQNQEETMTIDALKYQQMMQQQYMSRLGQALGGLGNQISTYVSPMKVSPCPQDESSGVEPNNKLLLLEEEEL